MLTLKSSPALTKVLPLPSMPGSAGALVQSPDTDVLQGITEKLRGLTKKVFVLPLTVVPPAEVMKRLILPTSL